MAKAKIHKPIDNKILKEGKEYTALGIKSVLTGVETTADVWIPELNKVITKPVVQGKEIYNLNTQVRSAWFIVDLETGKRGWYPGCAVFGKTTENTVLKEAPEDTASTITSIDTNTQVQILNVTKISECISGIDNWYKIKYSSNEGYIRMNLFEDLHYGNPLI